MSDDALKIIPKNPHIIPAADTHEAAVKELERLLPEGERCRVKVYEALAFIDAGVNLEAVVCPKCGKKTQLDYSASRDWGYDWWRDVANQLNYTSPSEVNSTMPCCGGEVNMLDMEFDWPAGFARFELSIWNPNISSNLDDQQLAKLEAILGCELRQVRAHY